MDGYIWSRPWSIECSTFTFKETLYSTTNMFNEGMIKLLQSVLVKTEGKWFKRIGHTHMGNNKTFSLCFPNGEFIL